jgi:hypothetical protein
MRRARCAAILLSCSVPVGALAAQPAWRPHGTMAPESLALVFDPTTGRATAVGGWIPPGAGFAELYDARGLAGRLPATVLQPSLALHTGRGVLLAFGFAVGVGTMLWEGRGDQWTAVPVPAALAGLAGVRMVFDSTRQVAVFAGYTTGSGSTLRLWDWDGTTFTEWVPQGPRAASTHVRAMWHAADRRVWLAENLGASTTISAFDGSTLQHLAALTLPVQDYEVAYDPVSQRMLLHGGVNSTLGYTISYATWSFDGTTAVELATAPWQPGTGPMTLDSFSNRAVVHCREVRINGVIRPLPALHVFDGTSWTVQPGTSSPPRANSLAAAFDAGRGRTVVIHQAASPSVGIALWEYDGDRWHWLAPASFVPGNQLAVDPRRGRAVFTSAAAGATTTSEWDGSAWHTFTTTQGPQGQIGAALGFDGSRLISFGGGSLVGPPTNETWAWDGAVWIRLTPTTTPTARFGAKMAFDERRGRLVMYGGTVGQAYLNETWEWDGSDWSLRAQGPMSARRGFAFAWHPHRGRCVLHGGETGFAIYVHDTWEWDGIAWQQVVPDGTPPDHLGVQELVPTPGGELVHFGFGMLDYTSVAPATFQPFGGGCTGSVGVAHVTVLPGELGWVGDVLGVRVAPIPAAPPSVLLMVGASRTSWPGSPLPLSLAFLGAPGCRLLVSPDVLLSAGNLNGEARWSAPVPFASALIGSELHFQAAVPDPTVNFLGLSFSDGATARIGAR